MNEPTPPTEPNLPDGMASPSAAEPLAGQPNGHGNSAAPKNETRDARFPLPNPPPGGVGANALLRQFHV